MAFDYRTELIQTASALLEMGRTSEALFHLERLVINYPDSAEANRRLGEGYLRGGLLAKAYRAYEAALALEPDHVPAILGLAACLQQAGQTDTARPLLEQVIHRDPDNIEGLLLLGKALLNSGDLPGSLTCFEKAVALKPDHWQAQWQLGQAFYLAHRWEAADTALQRAAVLAPTLAMIPKLLAVLCWQQGEQERAFQHIREAVALGAQNPEIALNYAMMQAHTAGPEAAAGLLEQYLALHDEPSVRSELAALRRQAPSPATAVSSKVMRRSEPRLVVFVGNWPRIRHAKLAYGLRRAGWQTVLLCREMFDDDITSYFDEVRFYRDDWEALALACSYSPRVYHVFSIWSDSTSVAMVRHKPGKVVYDCYDVIEGISTAEHEVSAQRFCIENADGLCCRDLRPNWVARTLGYKLPPRLILFMDYCWDRPDTEIQDTESDGIHLVSCGSFSIEKLGQTDGGYLSIAEMLAEQGIHFHIYPSPLQLMGGDQQFESIFSEYVALSQRTPYFHFHRPLPAQSLMKELRRFHLGVAVSQALAFGEPLKRYTPEQLRYCGSSRIFDYLDAGLPVMSNRALSLQYFILSRHKVGIDTTFDLLAHAAERLKPFSSPEFKAGTRQARAAYAVHRQIGRLIAFYENI